MIVVIIAGGSGTRLWPLSTPKYPKHLLKLNGQSKTLLQSTYERAKKLGNSIYVVSEASHDNHVKDQLPELEIDKFIVEPGRRGTASCIVAALDYIEKRGHDMDEPIAFMAADHYIRDNEGFAHSFRVAESISQKNKRIVLVGAEPDYPATGFGYIQKDGLFDEELFVFNVHSFKEKPSHEVAKKYINSGNYLWNCGNFVGSLSTFLEAMENHSPKLLHEFKKLQSANDQDYSKTYLDFENDSIDYALIERVNNLLVVPASFDWVDLGSYSDLHKVSNTDETGNYIEGTNIKLDSAENSFIISTENKPVAVIGLDNVVIVNTPEGLLVARKDMSQQVGNISKQFNKE